VHIRDYVCLNFDFSQCASDVRQLPTPIHYVPDIEMPPRISEEEEEEEEEEGGGD